jgi:hypothetical protein
MARIARRGINMSRGDHAAVRGIHDAPDVIGKLEEGTDILPVILPVADRIGILLPPFFPDLLQL